MAKESEVMQKTLQDAGINLERLRRGAVSLDELQAGMKAISKTNKEVNTRFTGMQKAISDLNEPLNQFMTKMKETSTVDDLVAGFRDIGKVLLDDKNPFKPFENLAAFSEKASDSQLELLGTSKKIIENAKDNEKDSRQLLTSLRGRFKQVQAIFETERKQQITQKARLKTLKTEISLVKSRQGIAGQAAILFDKELEVRDVTALRMQQEIDMQKQLAGISKDAVHTNANILQMERELQAFLAQRPNFADRALAIKKEELASVL